MVSGGKPNFPRRRKIAALRASGLTLAEIGRRLGISKQCVHETLRLMRSPRPVPSVPCAGCGWKIASAGALPDDAGIALCPSCLARSPQAPFGTRLKSLRLAAGLTRTEMARRAGLVLRQLADYEAGRHVPRPLLRDAVALAIGRALLAATGP
jgi:transcriptional regulator with XRE-family HTH domain